MTTYAYLIDTEYMAKVQKKKQILYKKKPVYLIEVPRKSEETIPAETKPVQSPQSFSFQVQAEPEHLVEEPAISTPPWKIQEHSHIAPLKQKSLTGTKPFDKKMLLLLMVSLFIVVMMFMGFMYFLSLPKSSTASSNSQLSGLSPDHQKIIETVSRSIDVPSDEVPSMATIDDLSSLQNQAVFRKAQVGDIAILYSKAEKAIIYRPSTGKIITAVDIKLGSGSPTPSVAKTYTVTLRNGTTRVGLTNTYEQFLSTKTPNLKVTEKENAANKNYEKTMLVSAESLVPPVSSELSDSLGIVTSLLPEDESPFTTDVLIIVGADQL